MSNKILINAVDPEECRIAKVKENKLEEFHLETAAMEITKGNIYKGVIARIEPSLQAVFVDYGAERNGFLQKNEIHTDYFQEITNGNRTLMNLLKRGQEILVQVTKDPVMKKGSSLTTFISLPGRYAVLMPGSKSRGISRKIEGEDERKRLKKIVNKLKLPDGYGIIVRTAGRNCTKALIEKDLNYLMRLWKNIKKRGIDEKPPVQLYKERNLAVRSIRDYFTSDVKEILIDDETVYNEVIKFIGIISPKHKKIVKRYNGAKPIFSKYQLEDQLASVFENRVKLKSGGSIVLEQTEALVSIDVNSGKAIKNETVEQTALQTNLEAAEEISRQLRLRDLGGLIVIDFIDMRDRKHKNRVEIAMKSNLKDDKAKIKVGKISRFGLMEMSRQRLRQSIETRSFESCKHCRGKGLTQSAESLALGFLRKLRLKTIKGKIATVKGLVPLEVADYLLNRKRKELIEIEERRGLTITIDVDINMVPGESRIICK